MTNIAANPGKTDKNNAALPSLGNSLDTQTDAEQDAAAMMPMSEREIIEGILEGLEHNRASLTTHIKALNGIERGSYRVKVSKDTQWNEITVRLTDTTGTKYATGHIDMGHTREDRDSAAQELRGLVKAYLCR